MARPRSAVYISDVLVIKACNTPGGSGGVADEMNRMAKRTLQRAQMTAPVNNPQNATHRGGEVGTYKASFRRYRRGNGHYLLRTIYNIAPHAVFVEKGRRSTHFGDTFWGREWQKTPTHWLKRQGGGMRGYDPTIRYSWFTKDEGMLAAGLKWEQFGWTRYGGRINWYAGTSARDGKHTLENAWKWSTRKYTVALVRGRNVRANGRIPSWAGPGSRPTT